MKGTATKTARVLHVVDVQGNVTARRVDEVPFSIGRAPDNNLVLRDGRISRYHARLVQEGDDWILEDLTSRGGLRLNGVTTERATLLPGDAIDFGLDDSFKILLLEEPAGLFQQAKQAEPEPQAPTSVKSLRSLVEVTRALRGSLPLNEVLVAVLDAVLEVTGGKRAWLLLNEGETLAIKAVRPVAQDVELPLDQLHDLLDQRSNPLNLPLAGRLQWPDTSSPYAMPLLRPMMAVTDGTATWTMHDQTLGVLLVEDVSARALAEGCEALQTLAVEVSGVLENARLLEQTQIKDKMDQELRLARSIQHSMLPQQLPESGWLHAAGGSLPSAQVGGDFFELVPCTPDCWFFVVADVSGKGVPAALLASLLQGGMTVAGLTGQSLQDIVLQSSTFIYGRQKGEKYATAFVGKIYRDGRVEYVNAAHPAAQLIRANGARETLEATATPIGLLRKPRVQTAEVRLQPGDRLLIHSDGLTESRNEAGLFFDQFEFACTLNSLSGMSAKESYQSMERAFIDFNDDEYLEDDVTTLVLEYRGD